MDYIKLTIAVTDHYQEGLIAELMEMGFNGFEQQDQKLITYSPMESFDAVQRERIKRLLSSFPGNGFIETEEMVAEQNWNRQWEKSIKARQIGEFFIKPTWSKRDPPGKLKVLEIDPKMSFGTGYHESTRLMLNMLPTAVGEGDAVLDAGTGTGILAIASVKLGAEKAVAFDIDDWSINNAAENAFLNEVAEQITIRKGSMEVILQGGKFDVILANINRNTILDLLPHFREAIRSKGTLLLSGIQDKDRDMMVNGLNKNNFKLHASINEGKWLGIRAQAKL